MCWLSGRFCGTFRSTISGHQIRLLYSLVLVHRKRLKIQEPRQETEKWQQQSGKAIAKRILVASMGSSLFWSAGR